MEKEWLMIMIFKFVNWLPQYPVAKLQKVEKNTFGNSFIRLIDDVLQPTKSLQDLVKENKKDNNLNIDQQP